MSKLLNKKDCEDALSNLSAILVTRHYDKELTKDYIKVLDELITEHFNNPPLKFEELKKNMWVWDNKRKEYVKCDPSTNYLGKSCVWRWVDVSWEGEYDEDYLIFEENRFFRKQVE